MNPTAATSAIAVVCELCNAEASLYCPSDSAFLCSNCDAIVHRANFLVARHNRRYLCSACNTFTGDGFSGIRRHRFLDRCPSCPSPDGGDLDSLSSSSSSSSVCGGGRITDVSAKVENVFVNWSREIGVGDVESTVRMACRALKVCVGGRTVLPFRVCLAASMWLGLRLGGGKCGGGDLKRLEEITGVPGKIVLAAEGKVERAVRRRRRSRRRELEEGWAES